MKAEIGLIKSGRGASKNTSVRGNHIRFIWMGYNEKIVQSVSCVFTVKFRLIRLRLYIGFIY